MGKQDDSDAVQFEIDQQRNDIDVIVAGTKINLEGLSQDLLTMSLYSTSEMTVLPQAFLVDAL